MNLSNDAKILDRIKYAIAELQHAEQLFTLSTESQLGDKLPTLAQMEQNLITVTFGKFRGHRANMAKSLGMNEKVVTNRLRAYGLVTKKPRKSKCAGTDLASAEIPQIPVH
jgi:DNA-binding NtrC family response regulator